MPSPKPLPVVVTDAERQVLEGWVRRRKTAQALALRSRIVLACAGGGSNAEVAAAVGIARATVKEGREGAEPVRPRPTGGAVGRAPAGCAAEGHGRPGGGGDCPDVGGGAAER